MGGMIKCLKCGDVLHSLYRHDFVACSCPEPDDGTYNESGCYVDGGFDYTRIGGHPKYIEIIAHTHTYPEGKGGKDEVILTDTMYASLM